MLCLKWRFAFYLHLLYIHIRAFLFIVRSYYTTNNDTGINIAHIFFQRVPISNDQMLKNIIHELHEHIANTFSNINLQFKTFLLT